MKDNGRHRAVAYCRYSSDQQNHTSIERQKELARAWCEKNGVTLVESFSDEAVSSKVTGNLEKQLGRCLDFIEKDGKIQYFITEDMDRVSRENPITFFGKLSSFLMSGISIVQTQSNDVLNPKAQSMDQLKMFLSQWLGSQENEKKRLRIKESYKRRFKDGVACPKIPFGYRRNDEKNIVVDQATAKIVKRIFKDFIDGMTYNHIAKSLNHERLIYPGAKSARANGSPFGVGWTTQVVRRIVSSSTYYERSQKTKHGVISNVFPAIIDQKTWKGAQARMAIVSQRKQFNERANLGDSSNLFSDLLFCKACSGKIQITCSKSPTYRRYGCIKKVLGICKNRFTFDAITFERQIIRHLLGYVDSEEFKAMIHEIESADSSLREHLTEDLAKTKKELSLETIRLSKLMDRFADADDKLAKTMEHSIRNKQGEIDSLEKRIADLEAQLEKLDATVTMMTAEFYKDIITIKKLILSGGTHLTMKGKDGEDVIVTSHAIKGNNIAKIIEDESEKASVNKALTVLESSRRKLKALIAQFIERVEIDSEGKGTIHFTPFKVEQITIHSSLLSLSHSVS